MADPEARKNFQARKELIVGFSTRSPDAALAWAVSRRDNLPYPERAMWEALELMMSDEVLRDKMLSHRFKQVDIAVPIEQEEQEWQDYRKLIARYRVLVELARQSTSYKLRAMEVIPHVRLPDLRVRLSDLLANQTIYFPNRPSSFEDRQEAFKLVKEVFYEAEKKGIQAEHALVGVLRYGVEWAKGGVIKSKDALRPSVYIEHTMPREDVLRLESSSQKNGRYNGYDFLYCIPGQPSLRYMQMKTGVFDYKSLSVNLPYETLVTGYQAIERANWLQEGQRLGSSPGKKEYQIYAHAIEECLSSLPLDKATQRWLSGILIPRRRPEQRPREAKPWSLTFQDVRWMMDNNIAFKQAMTLRGAPPTLDVTNFSHWTNLIRRLRQEEPGLSCWEEWPTTLKKKSRQSQQATV